MSGELSLLLQVNVWELGVVVDGGEGLGHLAFSGQKGLGKKRSSSFSADSLELF